MTVEKSIPKQTLRPITTGANSVINQFRKREKNRVQGFDFASLRLKNLRESFKSIAKRSNRYGVISAFDSQLKTTLSTV